MFNDPQVLALAKAARQGDVDTIDRLVEEGVDVNARGSHGVTPLFVALHARNREGYERLLEHGADPNIQSTTTGESVISLAAKVEDESYFLEMALKHGGDSNLVDTIGPVEKGQTPIYNAIHARNFRNIQLLVNAGTHLNHQDEDGQTPAMHSTEYRYYYATYYFLQLGADWRIKNKNGQDLAFYCYMNGPPNKDFREDYEYYFKVLDFLRDKGVNLDAAKQAADKHMGRD